MTICAWREWAESHGWAHVGYLHGKPLLVKVKGLAREWAWI